jgi:hypothetical protein
VDSNYSALLRSCVDASPNNRRPPGLLRQITPQCGRAQCHLTHKVILSGGADTEPCAVHIWQSASVSDCNRHQSPPDMLTAHMISAWAGQVMQYYDDANWQPVAGVPGCWAEPHVTAAVTNAVQMMMRCDFRWVADWSAALIPHAGASSESCRKLGLH